MNNAYIKLLRPHQWTKNAFVLAPLFFSFLFTEFFAWKQALIAVIVFMLLSSSTYIINDIHDIEEDKQHPRKKQRPIASGLIAIPKAIAVSLLLLATSLLLCFLLPTYCVYVALTYLAMNLFYSFVLKHIAIFDVITIATGFVLRILMGSYALSVSVSPWIILTTFLLALFLGFGKRYHELSIGDYAKSRNSLHRYSKALLDRLLSISCATTFMSYALYTVETSRDIDRYELVFTVIFVGYGLFRYLQAIYLDEEGGEPEKLLLKDRIFLSNCTLWLITTLWILA